MKKIIILAILIIAQNQLMAQSEADIASIQHDAIVTAKIQKINKDKIENEKRQQSEDLKATESKNDFSYIVAVPDELKHKNKKSLDKSTATGAPASSMSSEPAKKNDEKSIPEYGDQPFSKDYDKLKD